MIASYLASGVILALLMRRGTPTWTDLLRSLARTSGRDRFFLFCQLTGGAMAIDGGFSLLSELFIGEAIMQTEQALALVAVGALLVFAQQIVVAYLISVGLFVASVVGGALLGGTFGGPVGAFAGLVAGLWCFFRLIQSKWFDGAATWLARATAPPSDAPGEK